LKSLQIHSVCSAVVVFEMTYNVSSLTLNYTIPYSTLQCLLCLLYSVSQKIPPEVFWNFSQTAENL